MNTKYTEVELCCFDDRVEVWYKGRHWLSFAVGDEGNVEIAMSDERFDAATFAAHLPLALQHLDISIVTRERLGVDTMALPKLKKTPATDDKILARRAQPRSADSVGVEVVERHTRDRILNDILDSWIDHPTQTKAETVAETKRLADKYEEGLFVVAGVRAALTRGSYGDYGALLSKRRAQRAADARKAAAPKAVPPKAVRASERRRR